MWRTLAALVLVVAGSPPVVARAGDQCGVTGLVTYVFDGDTVSIAGIGRVRLLGIDAPEIGGGLERPAPFALEAKAMLQALVLKRWVRVDCDGMTHDVYGRVLAYVLTDTRAFVNAELVRAGLARVSARRRLQRLDELRQAEDAAERDRRGMWGERPRMPSSYQVPRQN